jgi:hypothetical protein
MPCLLRLYYNQLQTDIKVTGGVRFQRLTACQGLQTPNSPRHGHTDCQLVKVDNQATFSVHWEPCAVQSVLTTYSLLRPSDTPNSPRTWLLRLPTIYQGRFSVYWQGLKYSQLAKASRHPEQPRVTSPTGLHETISDACEVDCLQHPHGFEVPHMGGVQQPTGT